MSTLKKKIIFADKTQGLNKKAKKGIIPFWTIKSGEEHYRWIKDRTKLARRQERNDSAYWNWAMTVKNRDNWKCKINNKDCEGKVVAHHILPWKDFPELRYEINNGITLCHAHHPRKRAEEKRLIPLFNGLVAVSEV